MKQVPIPHDTVREALMRKLVLTLPPGSDAYIKATFYLEAAKHIQSWFIHSMDDAHVLELRDGSRAHRARVGMLMIEGMALEASYVAAVLCNNEQNEKELGELMIEHFAKNLRRFSSIQLPETETNAGPAGEEPTP